MAATITALMLVVIMMACSSESASGGDHTDDAQEVEQQILAALDADIQVECDDEVALDPESEFRCDGLIDDQQVDVLGSVDEAGEVSAQLDGALFTRGELESAVAAQAEELLGMPTTVTCGGTSPEVVVPSDGSLRCQVTASDGSRGSAAVAIAPDGTPDVVEISED